MRTTALLCLFGLPLLNFPCHGADSGVPASSRSRTILFVDDQGILYRSGTRRLLHPLQRHPANPLLPGRDKPWEAAIGWTSVYRNPAGRYQLWYQAFAGDESRDRTRRCTVCYAESADGIHFTKPNLGLFDYNGMKDTAIVLVGNGGTSDRYGVSVVVDPREPDASRRYKMAYFDFTKDHGVEYPGLNVAFSPDGIHWTKHAEGPLSRAAYGDYGDPVPFADETKRPWAVPLSMADALDALYDPVREVFAIYGKMWIDGPDGGMHWKHAMGRIESKDFIHWSQAPASARPGRPGPALGRVSHLTRVLLRRHLPVAAPNPRPGYLGRSRGHRTGDQPRRPQLAAPVPSAILAGAQRGRQV